MGASADDSKRTHTPLESIFNEDWVPYPLVTISIDVVDGSTPDKQDRSNEASAPPANRIYDEKVHNIALLRSPGRREKQIRLTMSDPPVVSLTIAPKQYCHTTELHRMVLDGDAKSLEEKLKEHKLDINSKDSFRNTPLILAAVLGRTECIKVLLINGAKIRSRK
eukprot:1318912-Amorphochlora_amoeboformis.AAC.1